MTTANNRYGILSLWGGWTMSVGLIALLFLSTLWVTKPWLPFVAIGLQLVIYARIRSRLEIKATTCYMMPFVSSQVLFWSAMVMFAINFMVSRGYIHHFSSNINPKNPYITVLVVAPVEIAVALWALYSKNPPFCINCRRTHGEPVERGFLGLLFAQESKFQLKMFLVLATVLTVVSWGYYFLFYININLNTPDRFFYVWVPILYSLATIIYMGMRYAAIYTYYHHNRDLNPVFDEAISRVRFLIISGDKILLAPTENALLSVPVSKLDTPVALSLPRRDFIPVNEAEDLFFNYTSLKAATMRFMYKVTANSTISNVFHFIATLDDRDSIAGTPIEGGEWFTIHEIQKLLEARQLDSRFSAEVVRLHDVVMAWKTYDKTGRRRYKIANYVPSFRLRDINSWDVDFNDPLWLNIKACNQDTRLWKLRRFWRRYIDGLR